MRKYKTYLGEKKNEMKHWPQQMRHLKTAIAWFLTSRNAGGTLKNILPYFITELTMYHPSLHLLTYTENIFLILIKMVRHYQVYPASRPRRGEHFDSVLNLLSICSTQIGAKLSLEELLVEIFDTSRKFFASTFTDTDRYLICCTVHYFSQLLL